MSAGSSVTSAGPVVRMLTSEREVLRCLVTYTDWWQPTTASVYRLGGRHKRRSEDGFRTGLIETLDERTELSRRTARLTERERQVLFLWHVRQLSATEISRTIGISRRHCFRVRARAIRRIVEMGRPNDENEDVA